ICKAVTGLPAPGHPTCGDGTACGPQCNGFDLAVCHAIPQGSQCQPAGCFTGILQGVSLCSAASASVPTTPPSCAPYASPGNVCGTSCNSNSDCFQGFCIPPHFPV